MTKRTSIPFALSSTFLLLAVQQAIPEETNTWFDSFYQYRIPVVIDAKEGGWNTIPVAPEAISAAVNDIEEMKYEPVWFDFNGLKVVEVDSAGKIIDPDPAAGFYLVTAGEELVDAALLAKKPAHINIKTKRGTYYILSYTSKNQGSSPGARYEAVFPIGSKNRPHVYTSYVPKMLPKKLTKHEQLFLTYEPNITLNVGVETAQDLGIKAEAGVPTIKSLSFKEVRIEFLADIEKPGKKYFALYYQPGNGHHLTLPKLRRSRMPASTVNTAQQLGAAEKYRGTTAYKLVSNNNVDVWFADTTVKLTPNTPMPRRSSPNIEITTASNEAQSFQVVLSVKTAFDFQGVRASTLTKGQDSIDAAHFGFYSVEYVPIVTQSQVTPVRYLGLIGDPLVAIEPKGLSWMDGNCAVWVTLRTPAGTKAGTYRGTLTLEGKTSASIEIPLAVEVYDFELPEYSPFITSFGGAHLHQGSETSKSTMEYHHLSTREELKKLARKYYDVMAENKFTPQGVSMYHEIGMNWSPPPDGYNVDKPGNYFKFHDWDFSEFNEVMKHFIDEKKVNAFTLIHTNGSTTHRFKHLPGKELAGFKNYSPHPSLSWQLYRELSTVGYNKRDDVQNYFDIEISQEQYDRLLMDFYRTMAENLEKHGWLDYAYIMIDETHYRGFDEIIHFMKLLKSDPLTARIKTSWCIQSWPAFNHKENTEGDDYAFNGLLDQYIVEAQENYNFMEEHYFSDHDIELTREKLWPYFTTSSRVTIDSPGINNRALGLEVFNLGGCGWLVWASMFWDVVPRSKTDNPWRDPWTGHGNGALAYFYPPDKNGVAPEPNWDIVPSVRVMTYREAVDDFEYAWILENLIAEAEKKEVDTSGAKEVLGDIGKFFPATVHWSQNDAWFLELRDRIARAIVELQKDVK